MNILILGAGGMLASDLVRHAPAEHSVHAATIEDVDITSPRALTAAVSSFRPDWIINAAAYTNVDGAEADSSTAMTVNGVAVGDIGRVASDAGCGVIHFSTDYIFAGDQLEPYDEQSPAHAISAYGRSKWLGEELLRASGARNLVLRTQWLFGLSGKSFPRTMYDRAMKTQPTRVVSDQFGRPTYTVDLARVTWRLLGREGIYHVTNSGSATWFELAHAVFSHAGVAELVQPCSTADYPMAARRPAHSRLSTDRLQHEQAITLAPWEDALRRFLAEVDATAPRSGADRVA